MAFKNAKRELTTSNATIYTCPADTVAIVLLCQVANVDGTNDAYVTVSWTDASDSSAETKLVSTLNVPSASSLSCLDGKLVLEAGDALKGMASEGGDLMITVSVMEGAV